MKNKASIAEKLKPQLPTGDKKDLLFVSIIYSLAHGLILFNNGLFWDDWLLYPMDRSTLVSLVFQQGTPGAGYLYSFLFSLPHSITLMRAAIFAAFLLAALLLYAILKTIKEIDRASRFFLVVIFAVFPVNSARIVLFCFLYAIAYLAFFLSFWLTSKYLSKRNLLLRVLTLVGFFISFAAANSLLFFYVLVIVYIAYKEDCFRKFPPEIHSLLAVFVRYADFVALPAVFWMVRYLFYRPHAIYEGYNRITSHSLMQVPTNLVDSFYASFIQVLTNALGLLFSATTLRILSTTIFVICCLIGLFLIAKAALVSHFRLNSAFRGGRKYLIALSNTFTKWYRPAETQTDTDVKLFVAGLLFFCIGVFPYLAVGKVPRLVDWDSRHQLLVPLGASFTLFYGFKIASNRIIKSSFVKVSIISVIVALFVIGNVGGYLDYQKDWFKEVSLIHNFKKSEEIKNHTTFLFDDKTANSNANNRTYRFYEYDGMLQYAFGDQSRFGSDRSAFNGSKATLDNYNEHSYDTVYLGLKDYRQTEPNLAVTIGYGSYPLTYVNTLKLLYYEKFDMNKFNATVDNVVTVQPTQIT